MWPTPSWTAVRGSATSSLVNVKYDSASPVLMCTSLKKDWCNVTTGRPACRQPSTSSSQPPTCHLPMASRLGNCYLRPTATNTARSTSCPAQPPPPWRQRPPSTFSLALSVHGLWARFLTACNAFHGTFLACGSPAREPPTTPTTICCGLFLRHNLGSAALVALYVIMICMRFPSRRRCGNRRTNLLFLWRGFTVSTGSFYFSWGFSVSVRTRLDWWCVEAGVCRSE